MNQESQSQVAREALVCLQCAADLVAYAAADVKLQLEAIQKLLTKTEERLHKIALLAEDVDSQEE